MVFSIPVQRPGQQLGMCVELCQGLSTHTASSQDLQQVLSQGQWGQDDDFGLLSHQIITQNTAAGTQTHQYRNTTLFMDKVYQTTCQAGHTSVPSNHKRHTQNQKLATGALKVSAD